ncbi:dihydrolipoyl dehydrogenase [Ferruginibacter paludis]|jgi:dihydrolipoamide dehydrogenase|uniref:dihydrolipoyl dehydrogenase n=1 Tax=Ferruginibacter paludis TaxID=1310417 RepID=UPI0025B41976|nr:dihydrolipoyl dehydrogenase [Ferruginibacter paludis]MDN3657532.1 dihydrolipoyl dehydrogenase [Ferruginibacter paludis]
MAYDVIVLGSGPGGYPAAIRASQLGKKVAIVEKESLGGICLNWGCIPTKALLKSANVYEYAKHAATYGIKVDNPGHDFDAVIKRSRGVADKMSKGVQFLMKKNKIDVVMGYGKLVAPTKLEVTAADGTKQILEAKNIVIATGGRARQLPSMPIDGKKIIGYREAMVLPSPQPKSMIICGSGAIGSEFAYFYNTMGTKVTIVEFMPRIVPVEDEDVSKELEKQFKKQGIEIMTNSEVLSVDTSGEGIKAKVKTPNGEVELSADILLSAVGVIANLENIGLEELGIKTEKGKIVRDVNGLTNIPGVYAIGDCTPGQALAHVATKEGISVAEHIAGHHPEPMDYNNIPGCTYCSPEIASVGYTEKAAKDAGFEIKVGKFPFMASGKASAAGATEGFVKVIYDAKYGEFLGCHMIGMNVTEMIAEVVVARKLETTGHEILNAVHPHPTMSEALKEATAMAYGEATDI